MSNNTDGKYPVGTDKEQQGRGSEQPQRETGNNDAQVSENRGSSTGHEEQTGHRLTGDSSGGAGSGLSSKIGVTGSDFDGQVTGQ